MVVQLWVEQATTERLLVFPQNPLHSPTIPPSLLCVITSAGMQMQMHSEKRRCRCKWWCTAGQNRDISGGEPVRQKYASKPPMQLQCSCNRRLGVFDITISQINNRHSLEGMEMEKVWKVQNIWLCKFSPARGGTGEKIPHESNVRVSKKGWEAETN